MIKQPWLTVLVAVFTLLTSVGAAAATEQERRLEDATDVVRQFVDIPENAIPPALLGEAYGIAVIPSVIKAGFVVGGRHGKGVLAVRSQDGTWSHPAFVSLTGASIGWQVGVSSSDIILVFKTQRSIDKIANGQITLGADAAVAAGPVGRTAGAATDAGFNAEVYSYSRSRGLFAGVSVEGGKIGIDREANWLFYDNAGIDAYTILRNSDTSELPPIGEQFVYTLDRYMPAADSFNRERAVEGSEMDPRRSGGNDRQRQQDQFGQGQSVPYEGSRQPITVEQRGGSSMQGNDASGMNDGNSDRRMQGAQQNGYSQPQGQQQQGGYSQPQSRQQNGGYSPQGSQQGGYSQQGGQQSQGGYSQPQQQGAERGSAGYGSGNDY